MLTSDFADFAIIFRFFSAHWILLPPQRLCFTRRLSVCLSVCQLATSCKNYWSELYENFLPDMYLWVKRFLLNSGSNPEVTGPWARI